MNPSWRPALAGVVLALPWLLPFAPGPSANVVPWMVSALCALFVFMLARPVLPPWRWLLLAAAAALWVLLRGAGTPLDRAAFAGAGVLVLLAWGIARGHVEGSDLARIAAAAWLAAALLSSVVALLQYFRVAEVLSPWVHPSPMGEALANLRQRNQFASLTAIGFAALLWWAGRGARLGWLLPAVVLLAVANAATTSRTGLLEWGALVGLAALWPDAARRRRLALCAAGLAAYLAATLALPLLLQWVTGQTAESLFGRIDADIGCSSRRVLWANVLRLIALRPLAGWGWGELDYAHFATLYPGARFCDILDNAHSLPLHVAVELGVPAALALCALVAWVVWRTRPWAEGDNDRRLAWMVLAVLAIHSLLEYPLWYGPFQLALGLALGLLTATNGEAAPARPPLHTGIAAACIALLAYAGWDYLRVSQIYLEPERRQPAWREDTLAHIRQSWLFAGQARFAELTLVPVSRDNARWMEEAAEATLHYSPEPRVIERAIESETMLGRYDEAVLQLARYRAAFPQDYENWREAQKMPIMPAR